MKRREIYIKEAAEKQKKPYEKLKVDIIIIQSKDIMTTSPGPDETPIDTDLE